MIRLMNIPKNGFRFRWKVQGEKKEKNEKES